MFIEINGERKILVDSKRIICIEKLDKPGYQYCVSLDLDNEFDYNMVAISQLEYERISRLLNCEIKLDNDKDETEKPKEEFEFELHSPVGKKFTEEEKKDIIRALFGD